MDELIALYREIIRSGKPLIDKSLLKKENVSESQWLNFLKFADELELNDDGLRILLEEIRSGRVVLK